MKVRKKKKTMRAVSMTKRVRADKRRRNRDEMTKKMQEVFAVQLKVVRPSFSLIREWNYYISILSYVIQL